MEKLEKIDIKNHYYRYWTDLIKPKGLDVDHQHLTDTYGKFYIRPLERGYGLTLGNAIRRVLLSSMMGSAVSAVKFEGVVHEFTTLPDVLEDVTDIILNLKQVRFCQENEEDQFLKIEKKGPGKLTAGDIQTSDQIKVLNPHHHLATLGENAHFSATLLVTFDRGYIQSQSNEKIKNLPVGFVGVDAIHSPVRRVNYNVSSARVGQRIDYDSLTLEVWTDGSLKPAEAVSLGYKILKEQLQVFINFDENIEPEEKGIGEEQYQFDKNLFRPVEDLELSVRSANCLKNAKIRFIGDLVTKSEQEMLRTKNFGRKSLNEIKDILKPMGLTLGMAVEGWPPKNLDMSASAMSEMGQQQPASMSPSWSAPVSGSSSYKESVTGFHQPRSFDNNHSGVSPKTPVSTQPISPPVTPSEDLSINVDTEENTQDSSSVENPSAEGEHTGEVNVEISGAVNEEVNPEASAESTDTEKESKE